jgi:hypothetical protein
MDLVSSPRRAAGFPHLRVEAFEVLGFELLQPVCAEAGYEVVVDGDAVAVDGVLAHGEGRDVRSLLAHGDITTAGVAAVPRSTVAEPVLHEDPELSTAPPAAETDEDKPPAAGPEAAPDGDVQPGDRKPVLGTKRRGRRPAASMDELAEIVRPAVEEHGPTQAVIRTALREAGIPIASDRLGKLTQRFKDEQADAQASLAAA